ncbi:lipid-A-disaccharide synthase [Sphingobacterium chungjuense]|uniref:lipid-A-disaccharide synthase n=1 Tax=Sphingobacterium chungjuense TaxID=2675553 RepID=UPI00140DFD90|nr:lipid-A-disaccharide synthase [Sphingobacterium chungjuense]
MKYYIIAGEASGDLHGANLIKALKEEDKEAEFAIVGGSLMEAESGKKALIHTSQMAFMGFVEVVMNLSSIARNLRSVKQDLLRVRPDTVILIDFPGFNLKIADFAKKNGITTSYYISPKIWAWNQKRVYKIKKVVDHMFCILPFEVDFYKEYHYPVDYVGNPLLDAISKHEVNLNFVADNGLSPKEDIIALLPGSRKMEIERILPEMAELYHKFPSHQVVIAGAPNFDEAYYKDIIGDMPIKIVFDQTYDLLKHAVAAVVTSGTATLETAILRVPQVVVYKANPLSIAIARKLIKVRFISLVNLINDYLSVHELIQKDCTASNIADEIGELITNPAHRASVLENYDVLREKLGEPGASARTASKIVGYLRAAQ